MASSGIPNMRISTDASDLDIPLIHRFLSRESYWAWDISLDRVRKAVAGSLCFGGYLEGRQIAFARVVTDYATSGHLKDVFVLPVHRGQGYGKALIEAVLSHPDLRELQLGLATDDAHGLYERYGFIMHPHPESSMIRPASYVD